MNSAEEASFRNTYEESAASSESEDEDTSSSSASSSDSSSSGLSSSDSSSSNSEDEAEIPTVTIPTSQTTQSTQQTTEAGMKTQASKTNDTSKTGSASKTSSEQTTKASSETKNTSSTGEVSLEAMPATQKPASAKAKSPEPLKQDDKRAEKSSKSGEDDSVVLKVNSSKNTETEITVKSSDKNSEKSATGVKKTDLVSEQIKKSSKFEKAAADKEGAEEQKDKATEKTTKPKKSAEKPSADEDTEDGKQTETSGKSIKCKMTTLTEKPSVDAEKDEKQSETSEKITISKIKKSVDKSPADDDVKKEEGKRETPEKTSKPKAKKSVDKLSVDDEAKEQRESETPEKTKKSTSSKQKQSLEKSEAAEGNKEDKAKELSEKIPKSSKSKMSSEKTEDITTENQKETTEENLTSSKGKKKLSTGKNLDAESEKSASEMTSKILKSKKEVENYLAEDKERVKKSEETSKKSEKSSFKKSQEKISDDKIAEVEKPKETPEKSIKPKKPKSSSDGQVADEKTEEKLSTKLNESEAQNLTSELTPKDPVKKRKKSPAKQTEEVSEKEGEEIEKSFNVVADKNTSSRSAKVLENVSTKLSVDEKEKDTAAKLKKTLKRSSKSPTPAKDETVDTSENKECQISTAAKESDLIGKAKDAETKTDSETLGKKEIVAVEDPCPTTDKIYSGLKTESESDAKEAEANKLESQARSEDAKAAKSTKIADDAEIPNVVVLLADRPSSMLSLTKTDADIETKAEESQPRPAAQGVDSGLGSEVKASEERQSEKSDEGIAAGPSVSEDALAVRMESKTAVEEEEDVELDFGLKRESVDDFIQRILSEVRESDKRMKELARGVTESSTEQANNEGEEPVESELKGVATEAKQVGGDSTSYRSMALEETTTGGGGGGGRGGGGGKEENRQRNRFADEDDEELAGGGLASSSSSSKYLAAARKMRQQTDYDDLDVDDLERRAREAAAEIKRRRKLDQDMEMEAGDYPPFTRTMYGPRVTKRNIQRYNLGDSEFEGREESFLSKFRRDRGGGLAEDDFAPRRREETGEVVRQKTRGVRSLVEQQAEVVDAVRKASKGLDELDKEVLGVKQLSLGHRAHVEALESAFDSEARTYDNEYQAATEGQRQRKAQQPTQEKKEDVLSLMFGPRPSVEPTPDVFSVLANTSTPAVASFLNIYGSGVDTSRGPEVQVNGLLDQRPPRDFGISADLRSGSKVDESAYFASERRNEAGSRRETGRVPDVSSILSGWSPTVSGISVDTSASDEFLSKVRSKYPSTSFSPSASESSGLSSRYADASSGLLGAPSDPQWISRFTRAAVEPASRSGSSGYPSSSFFPSEVSTSFRERGTSARRSVTLNDGAEGVESRWRRSGPDVYFGRSISSSIGTRTRRS